MTEKTGAGCVPEKLILTTEKQGSLIRLMSETMMKQGSPLTTASPAGSGEVRSILQRLEEVEMESRDLLTKLFSLLQTDPHLESYIRRKMQDPCSISVMWHLIEQLLLAGPLHKDKGVHTTHGNDDVLTNDRFKVRVFDMDQGPVVAHPFDYDTTTTTNQQ